MNQIPKSRRFINYLMEFSKNDNRAALARLRRSLGSGPERQLQCAAIIEPFLDEGEDVMRESYYLVGGLYAAHPKDTTNLKVSFGMTFKQVYLERHQLPSIEQRFLTPCRAVGA
jgi:hypothetical protein